MLGAGTSRCLAVIGIIYGALVAFAQDDVKKLVAYSSVSHLGFCVLGIFALTVDGIEGSIFAMLSHGLTTGGLFLGDRRALRAPPHPPARRVRRPVEADAGVRGPLPDHRDLGSAGLPGLSGFVGEFLTLFGTFTRDTRPALPDPAATALLGALAATGVILGAVYLLYMFQKVMFGPLDQRRQRQPAGPHGTRDRGVHPARRRASS